MNNEELKKKIVEVISQKQTYGIKEEFKTEDLGHGGWQAWTETTKVNNAEIADALIAAGIGDVSEYKEKLKLHRVFVRKDGGDIKVLYGNNEVDEIVKERNEYKHRAEVAERALKKFAENITCEDCPFFSDCASSEKMEDLMHSNYCFAEYLKQAEKELAEENSGKKKI